MCGVRVRVPCVPERGADKVVASVPMDLVIACLVRSPRLMSCEQNTTSFKLPIRELK